MNPTLGMAGRAAVMVSASVLAAMLATPSAFADTTQATLGGQADVGGGQQWAVSALRPSTDVIAYSPAGTLWKATRRPPRGGRGADGAGVRGPPGAANYPVLWPVPTAPGINPSALRRAASVTGKPTGCGGLVAAEVVFVADGADAARWVTPAPARRALRAPRSTVPHGLRPRHPQLPHRRLRPPSQLLPPRRRRHHHPRAVPVPPPATGSQGTSPAENPTTGRPHPPPTTAAPTTAATPTTAAAPTPAASQGTPRRRCPPPRR